MAITDQEATDAVIRTPGALGGATLSEILSENRPVNILSFNGVQPSVKSLSDRSYPLVKSFYLVISPTSPVVARQFARFVCSAAAGSILTKNGNLVITVKP